MDEKTLRENITGISHSGFYAEDLDRTAEFYTKVLGARVAWRNDNSKNPLMKIYIGNFGLSIIKRPPEAIKSSDIPHAIHWSYRVEWQHAEETVEYIKSCGVEVEGPVGHKREVGITNWFFVDPDGYRLEVEAVYPTDEQRAEVLERGKANRNEQMGLYAGDAVLNTSRS
jgi:catechol 2,3-dioxygenase-like lactoylglutathione lyase family enzyme